jgi:hypothetical protein
LGNRPVAERLARRRHFRHRNLMLGAFRYQRGLAHILALAIIACALLARVLIPQGWMPVDTPQGWRITICSGTGPMQMNMPGVASMKGMHHKSGDRDHGSNDHPCAFSSLVTALDETRLPDITLPVFVAEVFRGAVFASVMVGRGLAAPPPPATGPPSRL